MLVEAGAKEETKGGHGHMAAVSSDIVKDVRMCHDLVGEMVSSAWELGELYRKERKKSERKQNACCTIT